MFAAFLPAVVADTDGLAILDVNVHLNFFLCFRVRYLLPGIKNSCILQLELSQGIYISVGGNVARNEYLCLSVCGKAAIGIYGPDLCRIDFSI